MALLFVLIVLQDFSQFGIDWNGPMPEDATCTTVEIPPSPCPLTDSDYAEMCTTINPLATSSDYGADLYLECLEFVNSKVHY